MYMPDDETVPPVALKVGLMEMVVPSVALPVAVNCLVRPVNTDAVEGAKMTCASTRVFWATVTAAVSAFPEAGSVAMTR